MSYVSETMDVGASIYVCVAQSVPNDLLLSSVAASTLRFGKGAWHVKLFA